MSRAELVAMAKGATRLGVADLVVKPDGACDEEQVVGAAIPRVDEVDKQIQRL